jgi:hypothetical protein
MVAELRAGYTASLKQHNPYLGPASSISPWLLSTGWHLHAAAYQHSDIQHLTELPKNKEDPLMRIVEAVHCLIAHAVALIPLTPELVLQLLNSPDPIKECVLYSRFSITSLIKCNSG